MEEEQDLDLEQEEEISADSEEETSAEDSEEVQEDTTVEEEPPVRKSAKDYIIERKNRQIEKLKKQSEGYDDLSDDNLDVNNVIESKLSERLDPLVKTLASSEDEKELQAALSKYPQARKHEATIRKYMGHEAYSQVPVEFIVKGLLGGQETARREAEEEAKASRANGRTVRPKKQATKTAWDLSEEEFEAERRKIFREGR